MTTPTRAMPRIALSTPRAPPTAPPTSWQGLRSLLLSFSALTSLAVSATLLVGVAGGGVVCVVDGVVVGVVDGVSCVGVGHCRPLILPVSDVAVSPAECLVSGTYCTEHLHIDDRKSCWLVSCIPPGLLHSHYS